MPKVRREHVAILGGGSWGTALAHLLATNGHDVALWVFEADLAEEMRATRVNQAYFPGVLVPQSVLVTNDMADALRDRRVVVSVGPSAFTRSVCSQAVHHVQDGAVFLNAAKGLEPQTLKRMSEVLQDVFPDAWPDRIATLSGPTFALEVVRQRPTAAVVACKEQMTAERLQKMLFAPYFRPYTNADIVGVEFGGSLKNIVAIASGIVDGLGLGPNTQAALITRGLAEVTKLGAANGAKPTTFQGLSGIGDLVLTCTSKLSRNYTVGFELAQGRSLKDVLAGMRNVAEGVGTTSAALKLSEMCNVEMPITKEMFEVLFKNKPADQAIHDLMTRPLKEEMNWSSP